MANAGPLAGPLHGWRGCLRGRSKWLPQLALLATAACAPPRPSVVLVSIDSLRPDHLGAYGYLRETSPALDRLSRRSIVAAEAYSSTSWTLPAHAALFSSLPDSVHGCTDDRRWLDESRETITEVLKGEGYATAGFFSGPYLHRAFGFGQGFDSYADCTSYAMRSLDVARGRDDADVNELSHADVTNGNVGDAVAGWLRRSPPEPFFLFVHAWDVHADYIPPPPYDAAFDAGYRGAVDGRNIVGLAERPASMSDADVAHMVALYDAEILWTDALLARVQAELRRAGVRERVVLSVVSDHGEAFYERGIQGHRHSLHGEEARIAMLVEPPPGSPGGGRVATAIASIIDLAPTILDLAGAPPLRHGMGRSLISPGAEPSAAVSELFVDATDLAIRRPDVTLLVDEASGTGRAFDPVADPAEASPLPGGATIRYAPVVSVARRKLRAAAALESAPGERPELPEATEDQLRSLGYIP